jgi:hypothetical protein
MKKLFLVLCIFMLFSGMAFADHPDTLGLGGLFGGGIAFDFTQSGGNWGFGYPGLSLKIPKVPIFWAFYANLGNYASGFGFTGDFYIFDKSLVAQDMTNEDGTYKFKLDWYLGAGLFMDLLFWSSGAAFDVGARIPVGASWHIIKELELFLAVGPAFGIFVGKDIPLRFHFFSFGELGLRYWFK